MMRLLACEVALKLADRALDVGHEGEKHVISGDFSSEHLSLL